MIEPTDEQIRLFREAWLAADAEGNEGQRVYAGLRAVLNFVPEAQQIEMAFPMPQRHELVRRYYDLSQVQRLQVLRRLNITTSDLFTMEEDQALKTVLQRLNDTKRLKAFMYESQVTLNAALPNEGNKRG